MELERRAKERRKGAREGTKDSGKVRFFGRDNCGHYPECDRERSGGPAVNPERRQNWTLRTFRQKAMYEDLMERVVRSSNVLLALEAVVRNGGAAGIDKMPTTQLPKHLKQHWEQIRDKLLAGKWTPSPVRRVEIPKPNGGVRNLGIPTVMDRLIQQMLLQELTPIFDPLFSNHSYGFRPGRSAQQAVQAAQRYAQEGKDWVVDIDITQFFDHVNHDLLMREVGKVIRDKRVLRLIGRYLRSGVLVDGICVTSEEGTPQGGPLSPLLANIYLHAFDQELEQRGHCFSRYADDCNIYVGSQAAAERTMDSVKQWIETHLRLQVNERKSGIGRTWERKFLGFRITRERQIEAAPESLKKLREKVREMWGRASVTSTELRNRWRSYIRGWWGYFRLAEYRKPIFALEGWTRRHIRKCFWQRWHNSQGRVAALRRLGLEGRQLQPARSSRGAWLMANSATMKKALNNSTLRGHGFCMPSDLAVSR